MEYTEWKAKMQELLNKKGYDVKDWHRAIGIKQSLLSSLIENDHYIVEPEMAEGIYNMTVTSKLDNSVRFDVPQIIVFWTHKGGTGKTTLSTNIAHELAKRQFNVLAIDTDSQCDMTSTLFPDYINYPGRDFYDAFIMRDDFKEMDYIFETDYDNLDIVPGSLMQETITSSLMSLSNEQLARYFKNCLTTILAENYYDFIILDLDKNAGLLNRSLLYQADFVISPLECAPYSVKSAPNIYNQIMQAQQFNEKLKWLGVVYNKVNVRKSVVGSMKEDLDSVLPDSAFDTYISNDASIEKSQAAFMPLSVYDRSSKAYKQLVALVDEIIDRIVKMR